MQNFVSSTGDKVEAEQEFESEDDIPLSEWIKQFNMPHNLELEDLQTYVEIDEDLVITASLTDEEILD